MDIRTLPNLSMESLACRQEMKEITHQFMGTRIRYRWSGAVFYKVEHYDATDISSGWGLLDKLSLANMEDNPLKGVKRRLELSATEEKKSKVSAKT